MFATFVFVLSLLSQSAQEIGPEALEWFRRGEALIGTADEYSDQQAKYFEKAVEFAPEFAAARYNLALIYLKQDRLSDALKQCGELIRLEPEDPRGYQLRSQVFGRREEHELAVADLERASSVAPDNYEILEDLARALLKAGRNEAALRVLERILEEHPSAVEAYFDLALAQHQLGRLEEAARNYREFLVHDPDDFQANFLLGVILREQGNNELALEHFLRAESRNADSVDLARELGTLYLQLGRLEEAKQRLAGLDEGGVGHLSNLGLLAQRQGRWEEAAEYFGKALAVEPMNAVLWGYLGDVLVKQQKLEEAADAYRKAIECNPEDFDSLLNLGTMLANTDRTRDALEYLKKAVEIKPESGLANFNLAMVQDRAEASDQALRYYRQAIRCGVEDPLVYFRSAVLYARMNQVEEALEHLRVALEKDPNRFVPIILQELRAVKSDLDSIRYKPEFNEMLDRFREAIRPEGEP